ncbi:NAD-dependent epimerase/dehydratase family protein [Maridesulfovibrio salexigens]|uniref:NAD-dependent epimerase/dehydratase n=1 Tax=Maridesulfovibrio salexigens (strain ATCC 14822 / DSM 2638 / NCIMB 8403 / VKM B-1763) TaxID=526222 RepID=C6BZ99_MARSD|nr:NAD-dependent epimerase/dehydratase family protein [Maridesulfovibrio salexigens]ACS80736.1 NAD-dependent epimerase/dehydratase [Maridesulfovibrio salexigens DSM 2638]
MTKTCLVTGCAGFIGSHLTQALLDTGHSVVGVDNFASGYEHNMEGFIGHTGFTFYKRSIVEEGLLEELKQIHPDLDVVFQLAAVVSVPYSVEHPDLTMKVNFEANRVMLDSAKELGFSSFVFAGSAAEYGNENRLPVKEEYAQDAEQLSPYGVAKYRSSAYIEESGYGCSLRFFNIFGPRQDPTSQYSGVISRFVDFGLAGKNMVIFGDGEQTRDFLYVSDVVTAYLIAAGLDEHGRGPLTGIYNVGTGVGRSVRDLATVVAGLTSAPEVIDFKPERAGDIRHSRADVSRISGKGFRAQVSFEDGLARTVDWAIKSKS